MTEQLVTEVVPFFHELRRFYVQNRTEIRGRYRQKSRRFLDYNDAAKRHDAFLRQPQFEALEIYVFLKEGLENAHVAKIFDDWWHKRGLFEARDANTLQVTSEQGGLFDAMPDERLAHTLRALKAGGRDYANYIFALTMGTGKTILMATCIFYEFVMSRAYPDDHKFCQNALVIAPDTTVLESLREITTFDRSLVVPPNELASLESQISFHYMADADTLNVLRGSRFNVVIANAQKIILKRSSKGTGAAQQLFKAERHVFAPKTAFERLFRKLELDAPESDVQIVASQRFRKLLELDRLGIYVDEAHHAFGQPLARDVGAESDSRTTSLRETISELAATRREGGSPVVACYNFTGTPYYKKGVFPEVVYAYGLKDAIDKQYLKLARFYGYSKVKSADFVKFAIDDFLDAVGGKRFEGMIPKLAFFASTIEELETVLRPSVEKALIKRGQSLDTILVNTEKSSNDEIREFIRLDSPDSFKQFILLVNKGKEGWNCRSLFGVALFKQPKSKVFVLQASMRCLRSINPPQQTGRIYLSSDNMKILEEELEQNFRTSTEELGSIGTGRKTFKVRPVPPPRTIKIRRTRRLFDLKELQPQGGVDLKLDEIDGSKYESSVEVVEGVPRPDRRWIPQGAESLTERIERRTFSFLTLCAELGLHLNRSPVEIEELLERSKNGVEPLLALVNRYNEVLYQELVPRLFHLLYEITSFENSVAEEIALVEQPKSDEGYAVSGLPDNVVTMHSVAEKVQPYTFHVQPYVFASTSEREFFLSALDLVENGQYAEVYFTGMLTHGQSRFFVQYVDPETEALRSYYPDFLVRRKDGTWIMVEVKADFMVDDSVVKAKAASARELAGANKFDYCLIPATHVAKGQVAAYLGGAAGR